MNAPISLHNLLPVSGIQQGTDVIHESAHLHVTGSATFTDDMPELAGTLYAALIMSPVAHGELIGDGIDREAILRVHGVVAVYTAKDMLADPHIQARESIINVDVPGVGEFPMQNIFPFFSDTKPSIRWSGPGHGEHTDEVYGELLGYDAAKLADLRSRGIIK
jgi:xanthine dehydrogenase molybdopterin-binding subunit B